MGNQTWKIHYEFLVGGLQHLVNSGSSWLIMVNNHWLVVWNMAFDYFFLY